MRQQLLEGKTLTEVCRRQWWDKQQRDVILLHPCFVSLTLLFPLLSTTILIRKIWEYSDMGRDIILHHPLFLILYDSVVFVRN